MASPSSTARGASRGWWRSRPSRRPTSRWSASTCSRRGSTRPRRRSGRRGAASSRSPTRSSGWGAAGHPSTPPSGRGELEITDAIQWLVDAEHTVDSHVVRGWWKDTGRLDDMLEANRLILERVERRIDGELADSQIDGRVIVEAGAILERSTVRGPAIVGAGARLTDAYIGPYTGVGRHCVVESAEVEHSILLEGSSVRGLDGRMESSLLGRDVHISRTHRQPKAYRFMVGDNSEIGIL